MRMKEESERAKLKLNIKKKTKIMASSPITSWQIGGEKVEAVTDLLFLGSKITANGDCSCESWTVKNAEHQRIYAFLLWCWRRLLKVPWTAKRSNQSTLKETNPEYSLEGLMLKLKLHILIF